MTQTFYATHPLKQAILLALTGLCAGYAISAQAQNHTINDTQAINDNTDTQKAALQHTKFDPIVVTATRSNKYLSETPIPVQVLDKNKLKQNHAQTLKQALELLPNVYLAQLRGKTGYEVRMQGLSGDQVLVLIDGLPVSASTSSSFNIAQYLNTQVEQIEVIQGAASAQYGSSAMGGVINIITKPISDTHASITAELGTNTSQNPSDKKFDNNYSFVEGSVEGALSDDKRLKARLSGAYRDDKGLSVDNEAWPRLKDATEQKQVQAKISFTPDINEVDTANPNSRYWLEAGYYEEEDSSRFNYVARNGAVQAQQRDEDIKRKRVSAGGETKIFAGNAEGYKLSGSALYENYDSQSHNTASGKVSDVRDFDLTTNLAQLQLDFPLIYSGENQWHAPQLGLKYQKDKLDQKIDGVSEFITDKVDRDVLEAYVQDDWALSDNTELVAGVRYQDDSDFGSHFAPKLALKHDYYDANNHKHVFRASVGQGYRVPNLKERYYLFDHSRYGYKVMGSPDLKPEESISYQLGYQTQLNDKVGVSVNGFYNDVKNLIQTDNNHPVMDGGIKVFSYDNVDKAETYGGDIGIDWQLNDKAMLNLGYGYLHTKNKTTGGDLTYSPEHKVTANVQYQVTDKLQFIQQVRYESKQLTDTAASSYSPHWWGLDSRFNYTASPNLDLYMAINNLLDEQRSASDANDQRPIDNRQWLVGASYHW